MAAQIPEPGRWLVELGEDGRLIVMRIEADDAVGVDREPLPGVNALLDDAVPRFRAQAGIRP